MDAKVSWGGFVSSFLAVEGFPWTVSFFIPRSIPTGVLRVVVPVGTAEADREMKVTIEPLSPHQMTQEEWRQFIYATAGSIDDPTFVRHPQGEYERREELP